MPEGSKLTPSPLDAYLSAAPNEPTFTLQGGDPLAHEAVRGYIQRRRNEALKITDENKRNDELHRCTRAEAVLWAMEDYYKGVQHSLEEKAQCNIETTLDLHDYRIHCAQRISNAFSEMNDMMGQLDKLGWADNPALQTIHNEIVALRSLFNEIEPRPGMRIDNVDSW